MIETKLVTDRSLRRFSPTRDSAGQQLRIALIAFIALSGLGLGVLAASNGAVPLATAAAVGALAILCSIPLVRYLTRNAPVESLEPPITFSLIYFLVFGIG